MFSLFLNILCGVGCCRGDDFLWSSLEYNLSSIFSCSRSKFYEVVGCHDDIGVMFNEVYGISLSYHLIEQLQETQDIFGMKSVGWLVDNKDGG